MMANIQVRKANIEQENAIYHRGGKLLSAGAGSGKTFVLIEHLIYLLSEIKHSSAKENWNRQISTQLSKIVLMTFTKKAAGEMSVRMMRKVEELIQVENSEKEFWILVRQNLSFLNITTIHGFCHKLLGLGFWAEFPQQINLVSEIEQKEKIQKLFDRWFEQNHQELNSVFLASTHSLLAAMKDIFASPELRVLWNDPKIPTNAKEEIDRFFSEFITLKGYESFFANSFDLIADSKEMKKKWYDIYQQFNELKNNLGALNADNYLKYQDFFKNVSRFPPSSKEMSLAQQVAYESMKSVRNDLKNVSEDMKSLSENFPMYKKWVLTIAEVFQYIDSHYFEVEGFSFSDLEYYTLKSLAKENVLTKVKESYNYFIVDEFQDTSFIQFEILKYLIGPDKNKLFCVGDRKQAIYGFRGGELQVFSDCAQMLGEDNNLFLKNNFRSFKNIIHYNNELFERVFPLGLKYEGHDPHSVQMESQIVPESNLNLGNVLSLRTIVSGLRPELDLDKIEAKILCSHIESLMRDDQFQSICVLYRKLRPSAYLLEEFLKKDIPFSAQVKINFSEDPVIVLFLYLVELELHKDDAKKKRATLILIHSLLEVLGVELPQNSLNQFHQDLILLGLRIAFHKFLFSAGLSNSFHAQNAKVVDSICRLAKEDVVQVYNLIKNEEAGEYSCEMMSGAAESGKKRILIMSAHASKGLEFDAVLLGGVHTNGRFQGMKDFIGKFPHSFKWKKEFSQRAPFKSPFYHIESEILKLKDFSESKRLLYVACTRAIKELSYVNLSYNHNGEQVELHEYDNSWIQALRLMTVKEISHECEFTAAKNADRALIQQDSLGLLPLKNKSHLGTIAELSVTRLATIAQCPHKFYLQNICKIDGDEKLGAVFRDHEEQEEDYFYSSKKRGTEIHSYLSNLFLGKMSQDKLPAVEKDKILWAYNSALEYMSGFEIISEIPVKFSFFGQMISGTPDLAFVSPQKIVIWDFKTGLRDTDNEAAYWFQLQSYAYAYAQMKKLKGEADIELVLLYVDQKELVKKIISHHHLTQLLFQHWRKTESLDQMNIQHCSRCEYSAICHKGEVSPNP